MGEANWNERQGEVGGGEEGEGAKRWAAMARKDSKSVHTGNANHTKDLLGSGHTVRDQPRSTNATVGLPSRQFDPGR